MNLPDLQAELERICTALRDERIDTLEVISRVCEAGGALTFYADPTRERVLGGKTFRCQAKFNAHHAPDERPRTGTLAVTISVDHFSEEGPRTAMHKALADAIEGVRQRRFGFTREDTDIAYDLLHHTDRSLTPNERTYIDRVFNAQRMHSTSEITRGEAMRYLERLEDHR